MILSKDNQSQQCYTSSTQLQLTGIHKDKMLWKQPHTEFVATRTSTEQIIDIRNRLRYLGVPIITKAYMFGDNKSVITSATIHQSTLNKRHNMVSYHRVREAIAARILDFYWCSSDQNECDILSKHCEYANVKDTDRETRLAFKLHTEIYPNIKWDLCTFASLKG